MQIYTDGSAGPSNPGPGGWAVTTATQVLIVGHADHTTNIRMEGVAILEAMKWLAGREAHIYTDSQFWVNVAMSWAGAWEHRGWQKPDGSTPANLDLVQGIHGLRSSRVSLQWIRGHAGAQGNELADEWAGKARMQRLGTRSDF